MADGLNMNGLSIKDNQHGPPNGPPNGQANGGFERSAYVPPHMRGAARGPGGPPPPGPPNGFNGPPPGPMANGGGAWPPAK